MNAQSRPSRSGSSWPAVLWLALGATIAIAAWYGWSLSERADRLAAAIEGVERRIGPLEGRIAARKRAIAQNRAQAEAAVGRVAELRRLTEEEAAAAARVRAESEEAEQAAQEALAAAQEAEAKAAALARQAEEAARRAGAERERREEEFGRLAEALGKVARLSRPEPLVATLDLTATDVARSFRNGELGQQGREILSRFAGVLLTQAGYRLRILDEPSQRRAAAIKDYLLKAGLPEGVVSRGVGPAGKLELRVEDVILRSPGPVAPEPALRQEPPEETQTSQRSPGSPSAEQESSEKGEFQIQVSASRSKADAARVAERLRGAGYPVQLDDSSRPGWTRVVVGSFVTREEADQAAARLRAQGYDTWLQPAP